MSAPMLMTTSAMSARVFMSNPIESDSFQGSPLARAASSGRAELRGARHEDDEPERHPEPRVRAERADVGAQPREDEKDRQEQHRDQVADRRPDPLRELPVERARDAAEETAEDREDAERVGGRRRREHDDEDAGRGLRRSARPTGARRTVRRESPKRPTAQNATPSAATPASERASDPRSARPCVDIAMTAPSRIQPSTSSIAAAVIDVRPIRVRVSRVCIRIRPMTGIAVIETAVAKKSRKAISRRRHRRDPVQVARQGVARRERHRDPRDGHGRRGPRGLAQAVERELEADEEHQQHEARSARSPRAPRDVCGVSIVWIAPG